MTITIQGNVKIIRICDLPNPIMGKKEAVNSVNCHLN